MPAQELGTTVALPRTAVQAESDEALMRAVAERRDRGAYACLVERHQRAAYNLARHLTDSAEAAEDVLQEALLRAWASADTFRQDGSARGWLLRIVAREAFRANRRGRAERQRIERRQAREPAREEGPETMTPETDEQLAALHETLRALPEQQRAMLALYFGAELSQEEIGRHFNMPQKTVSRRITEILETLRGRLAQAGLAAAAPLLAADKLGAALLDAESPPAGLFERIGANLAHAGASASVKAAAAKTGLAAWWLWAAAAVAAGAAVAFSSGQPQATDDGPSDRSLAEAQSAAVQPPAGTEATTVAAAKPETFRWSFAEGIPDGIEQVGGPKVSFLEKDGLKGMALPPKEYGHFVIMQKVPPEPFEMIIRVGQLSKDANSIGLVFSDGKETAESRGFMNDVREYRNQTVQVYHYYVVDGFGMAYSNGALYSSAEHRRRPGDDYLAFGGNNRLMLDIEIRAITRDEIPADLRDPRTRFAGKPSTEWVPRARLRDLKDE